jgi:hypothetical protein
MEPRVSLRSLDQKAGRGGFAAPRFADQAQDFSFPMEKLTLFTA